MNLRELKKLVNTDLSKYLITTQVLLGKFNMLDDAARNTVVCSDQSYFPFYYHLGKYIKPKNMVEIGFGVGLNSGCFMSSCETVEELFVTQPVMETEVWRVGRTNILKVNQKLRNNLKVAIGDFKDYEAYISSQKWDLIFLNIPMKYDEYRYVLDVLWECLNFDAYMIVDKINSEDVCQKGFRELCKTKNGEYIELGTLYGSGIVKK